VRNMMDYYRTLDDLSTRRVQFTVNREGTEVSIEVSR
jgi:hypothetical protein